MHLCKSISDVRQLIQSVRLEKRQIGLVPTMGALHEGHLSLIDLANNDNTYSIASIFVNPTQFNNPEDLKKYPRTLENDLKLLEKRGCDAVFVPEASDMYPEKPFLQIGFGSLETELEGRFRPGHFSGVGLVVSKLFNIIQPDRAYFGQKDLQQFYIIQSLVNQLSYPIQLTMAPIAREAHGLAMSSRNERLSAADRQEAALLYQALSKAREMLQHEENLMAARDKVLELFNSSPRLALEYFEVISTKDFKPLSEINDPGSTALCIAAEIGGVRLIDNLLLFS